jgi:hypothetical protein
MNFLLLALSFRSGIAQVQYKVPNEARHPFQKYIDDSAHVFWTYYPNPISPPTVGDTGRGYIYSGLTFYCDLADTVDIQLLNEKDSVVCYASVVSKMPHTFLLYYSIAGQNADPQSIPLNHFKIDSFEKLKWAIVVNGKRKTLIDAHGVWRRGMYLWLDK